MSKIPFQKQPSMLIKEVPNPKHQRKHSFVNGCPQLLLTRTHWFHRVANKVISKLSGQPDGGYVSPPHGKEERKIHHTGTGRGIEFQMQVSHTMSNPVPDERWGVLRNKHVEYARRLSQSEQVGHAQLAQHVDMELIWQPEQCIQERTVSERSARLPSSNSQRGKDSTYLDGVGANSSPALFFLLLKPARNLLWKPPAALPKLGLFFAMTLSLGGTDVRFLSRSDVALLRWNLSMDRVSSSSGRRSANQDRHSLVDAAALQRAFSLRNLKSRNFIIAS